MQLDDLRGEGDEAYGNRVFLRHYCVQLAGPPRTDLGRTYPADVRAAHGFNGDIARHAGRWQRLLDDGAEPVALGCRVARKSLLAAAGLVSVVDGGWTTDRATAARRWAEIEPGLAAEPRCCTAGPGRTRPRCRPGSRCGGCWTARWPGWSPGSPRRSGSGRTDRQPVRAGRCRVDQ